MPSDEIALLTDPRYAGSVSTDRPHDWYVANIFEEDRLLGEALAQRGISSRRVVWSDPTIDWSQFRGAVFRSTWDYFDRIEQFTSWLAHVETQTRLCNDLRLIRWNMDKHYLQDLEHQGLPVVPSHFLERGSSVSIEALMADYDWREAVIKPCVSGAARHTYRIRGDNWSQLHAQVEPLLQQESFILQPFQEQIVVSGEDTLMLFQGRYTHAVRKLPKKGDFRVQDDHGGTVHSYEADAVQIAIAEKAIAACHPPPVYGRVDMVRSHGGDYRIMEVELIEPELWLRHYPPAADQFAESLVHWLEAPHEANRPVGPGSE